MILTRYETVKDFKVEISYKVEMPLHLKDITITITKVLPSFENHMLNWQLRVESKEQGLILRHHTETFKEIKQCAQSEFHDYNTRHIQEKKNFEITNQSLLGDWHEPKTYTWEDAWEAECGFMDVQKKRIEALAVGQTKILQDSGGYTLKIKRLKDTV